MTWNEKFMKLALHIAGWSKDPSTKVGAVIVNDDKRIVSVGYNGIPQGVLDTVKRLNERPKKYNYMEHAERNAIYSASRLGLSTINCRIYTTCFPCADCARAIIQSGIKEVIYLNEDPNGAKNSKNWKESKSASYKMMEEVEIEILKYV